VTSVRNEVMNFFSWRQDLPQNFLHEVESQATET